MNQEISNKQQLEAAMRELPTEYAEKLNLWWCRAQKPGKVYAIEYTDIEDLTRKIDLHTVQASKRSNRKRGVQPERQQLSLVEQCHAVISDLADVYGVTVKEVIKQLQAKIETARGQEQQKAAEAAQQAAAKMQALRAEHPELFAEYDALQEEQQKQQARVSKLSTHSVAHTQKRERAKNSNGVALF